MLFSHHILEMIRLFNSKRNKFWPMKPYILGKYSLRAFQRYVKQWLYSVYIGSYSNDLFFQVDLQSSISSNEEMQEIWNNNNFRLLIMYFQQIHFVNRQLALFFFFFSCLNELVCRKFISFIWKLLNITANISNKKSFRTSIGRDKKCSFFEDVILKMVNIAKIFKYLMK